METVKSSKARMVERVLVAVSQEPVTSVNARYLETSNLGHIELGDYLIALRAGNFVFQDDFNRFKFHLTEKGVEFHRVLSSVSISLIDVTPMETRKELLFGLDIGKRSQKHQNFISIRRDSGNRDGLQLIHDCLGVCMSGAGIYRIISKVGTPHNSTKSRMEMLVNLGFVQRTEMSASTFRHLYRGENGRPCLTRYLNNELGNKLHSVLGYVYEVLGDIGIVKT